ncbi:uncharacterized protein LOC127456264 [Myxocyprinus asiaticus]|uniref:uncharacterized protein LOC127456264 n=1 Tax=Myxocyprinus asiaticus TaxID=70543 RepID=UPI002222B580|nr:uncharacterized protein LOC127456264 [Myxocyprinus asiaticus]
MMEVLNENDNKPGFIQSSVQPLELSELTAVNSVTFTVQATDADGDTLTYIIDEASSDSSYFRMDLPNSGRVILNKSLDYESKTQLRLIIYAVETNTNEHYSATATVIINVTDGDDQYPQFQPCTLLSANHSNRICANPLYMANITENEQDIILDFSPGPIQAVDGDEGLKTPITYTILSGADNGRFVIDSSSGEVRLTRSVENRLLTPTLRLRIMAAQTDDPLKYAVATVLVRVLAENRYPPQFNRSAYRGFVTESTSPASLVMTYGDKLLILEATDQDFTDGFNPRLQYSLSSVHNSSRLFYITQEGILISRSNQLHLNHKYFLEVIATDLESGDIVKATIHVEVLQRGRPVPHSPLGVGHPDGRETVGRTEGVAGVCLILLAITLFMLVRCIRMRRKRQDPADLANVAESKHPNVTLRWFQLVNHGKPMPLVEEPFYHNEAFSGYDCSTSPLYGTQGIYTRIEEPPTKSVMELRNYSSALRLNGKPMDRSNSKTVSFHDFVVVRECDVEGESMLDTVEDNTEATASVCTDLKEVNTDYVKANADLVTTVDTSVAGFNTESQRITHSESERLNTHLKRVNTDYDITKPDPIEVNNEINPDKMSHLLPGENQARNFNESRQKDDTVTQSSTLENATLEETKASISEANIAVVTCLASFESDASGKSVDLYKDPPYSAPESSVEQIEQAGFQDRSIQIRVQDTDTLNQNITDYQDLTKVHQLSKTLDSAHNRSKHLTVETEYSNTDLDLARSNIYYVNEDVVTNLDNISPEENQESACNIDTTNDELHIKLGMNMQAITDTDIQSAELQVEILNDQLNNGD